MATNNKCTGEIVLYQPDDIIRLDKKSNLHFLQIAFSDKPVITYSLDVIISVGYRVKSKRGTVFRIWARNVLKNNQKSTIP